MCPRCLVFIGKWHSVASLDWSISLWTEAELHAHSVSTYYVLCLQPSALLLSCMWLLLTFYK